MDMAGGGFAGSFIPMLALNNHWALIFLMASLRHENKFSMNLYPVISNLPRRHIFSNGYLHACRMRRFIPVTPATKRP